MSQLVFCSQLQSFLKKSSERSFGCCKWLAKLDRIWIFGGFFFLVQIGQVCENSASQLRVSLIQLVDLKDKIA